jgi:hypothetical protein
LPSRGDYLPSGLLRCGHCGEKMQGHWEGRSDGTGHRECQCSGYHHGGKARCNCNRIVETPLVNAILTRFRTDYLAPGWLETLEAEIRRRRQTRQTVPSGEVANLRRRLIRLDTRIDQGAERVGGPHDLPQIACTRTASRLRFDSVPTNRRPTAPYPMHRSPMHL